MHDRMNGPDTGVDVVISRFRFLFLLGGRSKRQGALVGKKIRLFVCGRGDVDRKIFLRIDNINLEISILHGNTWIVAVHCANVVRIS
jgi:hypothetical protein